MERTRMPAESAPDSSEEARQAIYRRIHDQQVKLAKQQVRILEIDTYLSLARSIQTQQPDDPSNLRSIRHLEKMRQVAEILRQQTEAVLNQLWEGLR